jgi:signal transduction histidine kinase
LGVALRDVAEGIFVGTTVTISVTGAAHVTLSTSTKGTAFRIMREGLVNARKHSRARNIALHLEETDDSVIIRLVDDGIGAVSLDAGSGHLGLATMRGRAANEGGLLMIHSEPGRGTTVVLTLPKQHPTVSDQQGDTAGPPGSGG